MAITSADLLSPNSSTLYKRFGFKNPNNNIGAMANRLSLSSYERAAQGAGLASELEPERQGAIRALVANNNPANMVGHAKAQGNALFNQGQEQGNRLAQLFGMKGASTGAQFGAMAQGQNQGAEAANQLLLNAYSPQAQNQGLLAILQAIGQAPGAGLQELLALSGPVSQKEHDRMAREASQGMGGLGSLLGLVSQSAGMFDWSKLFGGGGKPVTGGSDASTSGWLAGVS